MAGRAVSAGDVRSQTAPYGWSCGIGGRMGWADTCGCEPHLR